MEQLTNIVLVVFIHIILILENVISIWLAALQLFTIMITVRHVKLDGNTIEVDTAATELKPVLEPQSSLYLSLSQLLLLLDASNQENDDLE